MCEVNVWLELILDGAVCMHASPAYVYRFFIYLWGAADAFSCHAAMPYLSLPLGNGNEVCQGHIIWQCGFFIRSNVMSKNIRNIRRNRFVSSELLQVRAQCVVDTLLSLSLVSLPIRFYPDSQSRRSTCSCPFSSSPLENNRIKCIQCVCGGGPV